jgi:4-hydroxy-tetrahydrodipicolinate synthase
MPVIEGVYAAAITPRREGVREINQAALWEVVDLLCAAKVDGIVLFGSTGEFVHYSVDERIRVVGLAVKRSRAPILVNVSHSTLDGTVELGRAAIESGAAGLLVAPPHYFRYAQPEILAFYRELAKSIKPRLPILLYHIPAFTNEIAVETAATLLNEGSYTGLKDSTGDWSSYLQFSALRQRQPFTFMIGHDALIARAQAAGISGAISGVASALPELLVSLNRAIASGKTDAAAKCENRLQEFLAWLGFFPAPLAVKEAVRLRGINAGAQAVPLGPDGQAKLEEFRQWFRAWWPQVKKEC